MIVSSSLISEGPGAGAGTFAADPVSAAPCLCECNAANALQTYEYAKVTARRYSRGHWEDVQQNLPLLSSSVGKSESGTMQCRLCLKEEVEVLFTFQRNSRYVANAFVA